MKTILLTALTLAASLLISTFLMAGAHVFGASESLEAVVFLVSLFSFLILGVIACAELLADEEDGQLIYC